MNRAAASLNRIGRISVAIACSVLLLSTAAWAQTGAALSGVVRDDSGLVLPGVTVEASSPSLIAGA